MHSSEELNGDYWLLRDEISDKEMELDAKYFNQLKAAGLLLEKSESEPKNQIQEISPGPIDKFMMEDPQHD
jgi:hypothetical protein